MVIRAGKPVAAGLSQAAKMSQRERARIADQLGQQYPAFRALQSQVAMARRLAIGSGLALAAAVMLLVRDVSVWWVASLVLAGFAGFGYVTTVLTDSRFDLLLAVLGAHRTDELHARLLTDQVYGEEQDRVGWDGQELPRCVGSQGSAANAD